MRCDGALVLPATGVDGTIKTLEFIGPDGEKRFLPNGSKKGNLFQIGDTSIFALASIDEAAGPATRKVMSRLAIIALGATCLALIGSFRLARQLTGPIGQLSGSLEQMTASREATVALPLTGSSRELDALTDTFNALMASVAS